MREFEGWEDSEYELDPIYCPFCISRGYTVRLGPKILMPGEPRPENYGEDFLECAVCTAVIPIYELPKEEEIKDAVETVDSPFDNKLVVETIPRRNSPKGKAASARKRNKKIKLDNDPEIDTLLRVYGDRVNVLK